MALQRAEDGPLKKRSFLEHMATLMRVTAVILVHSYGFPLEESQERWTTLLEAS